jgi:fermentation-respiration switch protein FrsA (DUF1100 family)
MKMRNKTALSIFAIFYIGFGFFLFINQERVIYRPFPQDFAACTNFSAAEKVTTYGTRMYVSQTSDHVIVLYHGNAGSACDRAFYANLFEQAGYGYAIVEYAGYSNDIRQTTHELIKRDVENVITYFKNNERTISVVVGESIGTGPATYHASVAAPERVLLITPFTDLADLAQDRFWFYPTSFLVDNAFDNVANLAQYEGTVGIIHGTDDDVIPYRFGRTLYEAIGTEKTLFTIEGADHNNLFSFSETYAGINAFLKN